MKYMSESTEKDNINGVGGRKMNSGTLRNGLPPSERPFSRDYLEINSSRATSFRVGIIYPSVFHPRVVHQEHTRSNARRVRSG